MTLDSRIFAAAQAGDPVALEQVLRHLQPDIRRYARRQCHRSSVIEDVVQEALIVLYRRVGTIRDPLALAGWLFRIVTRLCMLPVLGLMRGVEGLTERHETEHLRHLTQDELRVDLVRALESLPEMYREVNDTLGSLRRVTLKDQPHQPRHHQRQVHHANEHFDAGQSPRRAL